MTEVTVDELCTALGISRRPEGQSSYEYEGKLDDESICDQLSQGQNSNELKEKGKNLDELNGMSSNMDLNLNQNSGDEIIIDGMDIPIGDSIEISVDNDVGHQSVGKDNNEDIFCGKNIRKRRAKAMPKEWKRNKNNKLRMQGKPYCGFQNKLIKVGHDTVETKAIQDKVGKEMGKSCNSKLCRISKVRQCQEISEEERIKLFNGFWNNMTWPERKVYVSSLIDKKLVKNRANKDVDSRRSNNLFYFLKVDDKKYQVCQFMLTSTLQVTSRQILYWIKTTLNKSRIPNRQQGPSSSNSKEMSNEEKGNIENLKLFLNKLPKLPSHYTRKDTSKSYLEPIYRSTSHLIDVYKMYCKEKNVVPVSRWAFDSVIKDMNISLFTPKKDQCDICCGYESGNISEIDYNQHILKKNRAREEKSQDKISAKENKCTVLTMDLQAVKVSPKLEASALYYKTKLAVHNFYNLANNDATCFWWNESESDLVASSFSSCLIDFLTENCQENIPIIIYSDGCTYQNRNSIMTNALLNFSITTNKIVIQKYLEKGHTQMECDSVHSAIETKIKNRSIYLPSDYYRISSEARVKPKPYEVKSLTFDFFRDYSKPEQSRYKSIRPGKKVGDKTITDIRALKYTPEGLIFYKLDFDDDWKEIPTRPKIIEVSVFPAFNESRLKIKKRKFQELQELKKVLPSECHSFYDNLPH